MPIIVEAPDGTEVEFPDGTSRQVMKRAMANRFGGPKNKPAPAPTTRPKKSSALDKFTNVGTVEDLTLSGKSGRPQATNARERGFQRAKVVDETIQHKSALPKLPGSDFGASLRAGVGRGAFSLPDVIAAAVQAPFSEKDFGELLDENRGATDYETEKNLAGNVIGQVYGGIAGGNIAGSAIRKGAARVAGSGAPGAVRATAKAVRGLATAREGQRVRNLGKIVVAGGAGGAADAAGRGGDVTEGATIGAVAAPVLMGGIGAAKMLARPFADALGLPNSGAILRRFTKASVEDMQAAADDFRRRTGAEPTLFEILPVNDRRALARDILGRTDETAAQTAEAVRRRVRNVGPEMGAATREATASGRERIVQQMSDDLAEARGAQPGSVDPLATRAAESPIDLKNLQQAESQARMGPYEDAPAAENLRSIFPTSLRRNPDTGEVEEVFSDPEVNQAVVSAAQGLRLRLSPDNAEADIAGLTAGDLTRILRNLAKVEPGSANKAAAMRAEQRIMDYIEETNPGAAEAVANMRAAYARRARMVEGMAEGGRSRTRESIPVEKADQARKIRNAFDTEEGTDGRFLGQANALERDFAGTTQDVNRRLGGLVESGEQQAALRGNLGPVEAGAIQDAAEAQTTSMRALAGLDKDRGGTTQEMSLEDLGSIFLSLSPSSMIRTKAWALSRLTKLARLPDARAREIIDFLFSQNPAQVRGAINLLNRAGDAGRRALQQIGSAAALGGASSAAFSGPQTDGMPEAAAAEPPVNEEEFPSPDEGEYGSYDEVLADWEANEDPEFLDLIDAQFQQESGNQQFDEQGNPLTSSAGAIGIAQVMPGTAPEAAELAGLPWDEEAYYNDPAYNKLLGIAYMKEMLRRFGGDVALALAAYNAGPGAVENSGGIPNIAETQNYVDRILARR